MKKLFFALVVLFVVTSSSLGQLQLMYAPCEHTKITQKWLRNFIVNNKESISLMCDVSADNEYAGSSSFVVLTKNNQALVLFNHLDTSYIISPHILPSVPDDDYKAYYEKIIYGDAWDSRDPFTKIKELLGASTIQKLDHVTFYQLRRQLK